MFADILYTIFVVLATYSVHLVHLVPQGGGHNNNVLPQGKDINAPPQGESTEVGNFYLIE